MEKQLSKEQQEYFKNSKVRDSQGNLLVCYHGTPNPGFKEFNASGSKSQFGEYKFGNYNVNFFTTDRRSAASYTEYGYEKDNNVYACYVNIINPFVVNNKSTSEIKSSFNIKDDRLREKQIKLFDYIFNKYRGRFVDMGMNTFKELNNDLHKLNLKLVPSDDYAEDVDPDDIDLFNLVSLGNNSAWGSDRVIEYDYSVDELFDDSMYDELKNEIIGEDEDDYYLTTDDVVRYVLAMNEDEGTNYDGIIIEDIKDSKDMFSDIGTDIITLKSSNQIKLIDNEHPTSSNRIDERFYSIGDNVNGEVKITDELYKVKDIFNNNDFTRGCYFVKEEIVGIDLNGDYTHWNIEDIVSKNETVVANYTRNEVRFLTFNKKVFSYLNGNFDDYIDYYGVELGQYEYDNFYLVIVSGNESFKKSKLFSVLGTPLSEDEWVKESDENESLDGFEYESDKNTQEESHSVSECQKTLNSNVLDEVYPNKGESKKDFISRFMSVTKNEYPDTKQRYAIALSYWDRRNEELKEEFVDEDKKIYTTTSAYDVKNRCRDSNIALRILYDKKLKRYFLCDADWMIHSEMAYEAIQNGYYAKIGITRTWEADEELDNHSIHFIYAPKDKAESTWGSSISEDGYEYQYIYDFGVLTSREDSMNSALVKSFGNYNELNVLDGWESDNTTPKIKKIVNEDNSNDIILYHNTPYRNLNSIIKSGLKIDNSKSERASGYRMTWATTHPLNRDAYGGTTIKLKLPKNYNYEKVNDDQYIIYQDIPANLILGYDILIGDAGTGYMHQSEVQKYIDKFGKENVKKALINNHSSQLTDDEVKKFTPELDWNIDESLLLEKTRNELINKSKSADDYAQNNQQFGKNRYERRVHSSIASSIRQYNRIDMDAFFKRDILTVGIEVHGETDDYVVTMRFQGVLREIANEIKSNNGKLEFKIISRAMSRMFNQDNVFVHCTCPDFCLKGDTKIKLLNNEVYTIEELYSKYKESNGADIYVYSTDDRGDFKPGKVNDIWISGYVNDMIKVTLDNGREIITTPNHRYMLRDGTYAEAKDLTSGTSLMPLYFKIDNKGYEEVKSNSESGTKFYSVYKQVANTLLQDEINEAKVRSGEEVVAIHHKDFNKLNNYPSNLFPMGVQEHYKYHYEHLKESGVFDKFIAAGEEYRKLVMDHSTPEYEKQAQVMRDAITNYYETVSDEEFKQMRADSYGDEWKENIGKANKEVWASYSEEEYARRCAINKESNAKSKDKRSKAVAEWHNNLSEEEKKEISKNLSDGASSAWETKKDSWLKSEKYMKARHNAFKFERTPEIIRKAHISKISTLIQRILDNNEVPSPETYDKYRTNGYPKYTKVFDTWEELSKYFNLNHKVAKVEYIHYDKEIPVYDLSVDTYNNFYVDAGVILHNCYRQAYYASKDGYGTQYEPRPSNITNPRDSKGGGCKHTLLVLSNLDWMMKVASVINNYVKYSQENLEKNYADYIFPKLYGMKYDKAVQMDLFSNGWLPNDKATMAGTIERATQGRDAKGRWVSGNKYQFKKSDTSKTAIKDDDQDLLFWDEKDKNGNTRTVFNKDAGRDNYGRFTKGNTFGKKKQTATTNEILPLGDSEDEK